MAKNKRTTIKHCSKFLFAYLVEQTAQVHQQTEHDIFRGIMSIM